MINAPIYERKWNGKSLIQIHCIILTERILYENNLKLNNMRYWILLWTFLYEFPHY